MDLESADRRGPEETAGVLDQDVMNLRLAAAPPYRERLDPLWGESGRNFFVEELAAGLVGITLEGDGTVFEVGQEPARGAAVVVDDLSFGEADDGINDAAGIFQRLQAAVSASGGSNRGSAGVDVWERGGAHSLRHRAGWVVAGHG